MERTDRYGTCTASPAAPGLHWNECCCNGRCHRQRRPGYGLGENRRYWKRSIRLRYREPCPSQRIRLDATTNSHRKSRPWAVGFVAPRPAPPSCKPQSQLRSTSQKAVSELHHKTPFLIPPELKQYRKQIG